MRPEHAMRLPALLLALAALTLALPARALDWYTVELLVFAEQSADGLQEEAWSASPGWPELTGTVEPGSGEFDTLGGSSLELSAVARQLDRSGRYRTLLLTGWRQPGYGPRRAVPVHVVSDGGSIIPSAAGSGFGLFQSETTGPVVEGTVKVHRSRFLHVAIDLVYQRPAPPAAATVDGTGSSEFVPTLFRLTEGEHRHPPHALARAALLRSPAVRRARQDHPVRRAAGTRACRGRGRGLGRG